MGTEGTRWKRKGRAKCRVAPLLLCILTTGNTLQYNSVLAEHQFFVEYYHILHYSIVLVGLHKFPQCLSEQLSLPHFVSADWTLQLVVPRSDSVSFVFSLFVAFLADRCQWKTDCSLDPTQLNLNECNHTNRYLEVVYICNSRKSP